MDRRQEIVGSVRITFCRNPRQKSSSIVIPNILLSFNKSNPVTTLIKQYTVLKVIQP